MREARVGDRYLVCSDGLSGFVAGDTIQEILEQGMPPGRTADRLVELAMRAGAPDNVTCIIGDVVDLDRDKAPPTAPEVVGAAAERKAKTTRSIAVTPAAKASALARQVSGADAQQDAETESLRLAEEGPSSGRWHAFRTLSLVALVLAVLVGGGYAAYEWSQRQYYVGQAKGTVAIYQGISQNIGSWDLSHVIDQSDIELSDLPDFYRSKVDSTVTTGTVEDARRLVTDLRVQAIACQTTKATGGSCGSSNP